MDAKTRAWWFQKQGLNRLDGGPAEALARAGWARSVGGANPYVSIFARCEASKSRIEEAATEQGIHELPSARGCTYVVPREDFGLALTVSGIADGGIGVAKRHLGVTEREIAELEQGVLDALEGGPLEPKDIAKALGPKVRNLGEEGKKRGQVTTLPLALGTLQATGRIRRIPVGGRLDQQRFAYATWPDSPFDPSLSRERAFVELARKYWKWIGPAKIADFQWFSGLGVGASKAAVETLGLEDLGDGWLISPDERQAYATFEAPAEPRYALLSAIDSLFLLRRDVASLLDPADLEQPMLGDRGVRWVGHLKDLDHHAIVDRGRLIGFWEFDVDTNQIVWKTFFPPDGALRETVARMEAFAQELGDVRSFSLDSPESRKPRIAFLRS